MKQNNEIVVKVASEDWEFEQIHRLNYRTFVEEIGQHSENEQRRLVDRFHEENTYIVAIDGQKVIGMICVRDCRPFSLDEKLPNLDEYLPPKKNICEVRLLAIEKKYRNTRVILRLIEELMDYCLKHGYDLVLISAYVKEIKLYEHLGFRPFGPVVQNGQAQFQPMMLDQKGFANSLFFRQTLPIERKLKGNFLPGPVAIPERVKKALHKEAVSHRDPSFVHLFQKVKQQLCELVKAKHVEIFLGTGTLANDVIAAQLSRIQGKGLVLSNGEFGERLVDHARRFPVAFEVFREEWGKPFDYAKLEQYLKDNPEIKWLWAVHCETSTGVLNDLAQFKFLSKQFRLQLCLDCISSIGTVPVDLEGVAFASCVSGKGLRSYPGLSMVFYQEPVEPSERIPRYLDLGYYRERNGVPFTHSSNFLFALNQTLHDLQPEEHFAEITELAKWFRNQLRERGIMFVGQEEYLSPAVTTIQIPDPLSSQEVGERLKLAGFWLNYETPYLRARNWIQVCLMGEVTKEQLAEFLSYLEACLKVKKAVFK
jgi:aspartate aminotransferase-like enzyme/GNAT superfamily N-acetyltransferase